MKRILTNETRVEFGIFVDEYRFEAIANGHPSLTFRDTKDIVLRRSRYICPRTLAVNSDKAAIDLPRQMVMRLRNPSAEGVLIIREKT